MYKMMDPWLRAKSEEALKSGDMMLLRECMTVQATIMKIANNVDNAKIELNTPKIIDPNITEPTRQRLTDKSRALFLGGQLPTAIVDESKEMGEQQPKPRMQKSKSTTALLYRKISNAKLPSMRSAVSSQNNTNDTTANTTSSPSIVKEENKVIERKDIEKDIVANQDVNEDKKDTKERKTKIKKEKKTKNEDNQANEDKDNQKEKSSSFFKRRFH